MLILSPPTVFSRALFSTTLPTLGENGRAESFSRFQPSNLIPLRFVQHHGNVQLHIVPHRGMGKEESGGLGEKTRKGKGDCSRAAPLSPGCLPKTSVRRYCVCQARRVSRNAQKKMVTKAEHSPPTPGAQPQKAALHSARRLFLMFPALPSLPGAFCHALASPPGWLQHPQS